MSEREVKVTISASTAQLQQGMKQAAASVSQAAGHMKSAHGELASSSTSVFGRLKANIAGFAAHHKEEFEHMGHDVSSFKGAFIGAFAGGVMTGALLEFGEKIGEAVLHVAEMGDQMLKTSEKVGIGVEQLSKLKYAAELSDVSFEGLTKGMQKFAKNLSTVGGTSNDASRALDQLGITTKDAEGKTKDMNTLLGEVADQFAKSEDGTNKTAIAMALFGRAGADMIPMLNKGSAGLAEMGDEAERLGIVFTEETAESSEQLNDDLKRMNAAFSGLSQQLLSAFIPLIASVAKGLLESAKEGGALNKAFQVIGATAKLVISVFEGVLLALRTLATAVSTVFRQILGAASSFGSAFLKLMKGDFSGALADAKGGISQFDQSAEQMFKSIQKDAQDTAREVGKLWGLVKDPPKPKVEKAKKKELGGLGDAQAAEEAAKSEAKAEAQARKAMARDLAAENKKIDRELAAERKAAMKEELATQKDMAREDEKIAKDLEKERERLVKQQQQAVVRAAKEEQQVQSAVGKENAAIESQLDKDRAKERKQRLDEEAKIAKEMQRIDADLAKAYERQMQQQEKAANKAAKAEIQIRSDLAREDLAIEQKLELEAERARQKEVKAAADAAKQEIQIKLDVLREDQQIEKQLTQEHQQQEKAKIKATEQAEKQAQAIRTTVAKENLKIEQDLQKAHIQTFKDLVQPISSSFGQITIGILRGNQTISQSARKLGVDVLTSYGNMAAQSLLKWVEAQIEMTAVQELESAKRLALQVASGAQSMAMEAASALKKLANYAIEAFAGTVAATSAAGPEVSIPAGAGVMGAVLAEGASIVSAAGGYDVPRDMIASVHEKEMILPRALSERVRGLTETGGGETHLHVHAIDASGVKKLFQDHGALLGQVLRTQLRNFRTA